MTLLHIYKQTWLEQLDKDSWCHCPLFLLMLATWLGSSVGLVGPAGGHVAASQGRDHMGLWVTEIPHPSCIQELLNKVQ